MVRSPGGKKEGHGRAHPVTSMGTCRLEELNTFGGGAFVKRAVLIIALVLLVIQGLCVHAAGESDGRVQALLEELDLNCQIDSDGDFRLTFKFDNGRTGILEGRLELYVLNPDFESTLRKHTHPRITQIIADEDNLCSAKKR